MPAPDDKTLSQTIREVMTDTKTPSQASAGIPAKGVSEGTTGDTQSGGTPEYVSGIDISTLPEQERATARKVLAEKGSLLEKGYQEKFKEINDFKKQREEILRLGITESEAAQVIRDHVHSKTSAKDAKKEASRVIDQLKETAPDLETRKGLDNLEKIIMELTNIGDIQKKLQEIESYVKYSQGREVISREQSLNTTLDTLSSKYGNNVVDKYRDEVIKQGLAFPNADPKRLLHAIADPEELEQAILLNSSKKEEVRKQEKINAVSSPGSGMTTPHAEVDIRKTNMKNIISQVFTKK
jgi:hypothetical protein